MIDNLPILLAIMVYGILILLKLDDILKELKKK